jgi:hypothetical protein
MLYSGEGSRTTLSQPYEGCEITVSLLRVVIMIAANLRVLACPPR